MSREDEDAEGIEGEKGERGGREWWSAMSKGEVTLDGVRDIDGTGGRRSGMLRGEMSGASGGAITLGREGGIGGGST